MNMDIPKALKFLCRYRKSSLTKNKQDKNFVYDLHRRIIEIDSAHDFKSMTTIGSKMDSDLSIKCLSFHTNQNSTNSLSQGDKHNHVLLNLNDDHHHDPPNQRQKSDLTSCEENRLIKREI